MKYYIVAIPEEKGKGPKVLKKLSKKEKILVNV
jgi:hypothetical protein